jgi:hypothetical protein
MSKQSDLVRDLTDPGWREREAERDAALLAAVPVKPKCPYVGRCHPGHCPCDDMAATLEPKP